MPAIIILTDTRFEMNRALLDNTTLSLDATISDDPEVLERALIARFPALARKVSPQEIDDLPKGGFVEFCGQVDQVISTDGETSQQYLTDERMAVETAERGWQVTRSGETFFVSYDSAVLVKKNAE